jgi:hypothetical protein
MFYLLYLIFSLGAAMLQSAYLRAPKGVVPSRRRITYTVIMTLATAVQILVGAGRIDPWFIGAFLCVPVFYVVSKTVQHYSLRLRYTFRIGLALTILTAYPLIHDTWQVLAP